MYPNHPSSHPFAVTKHFDDQGILITETVVITDGFGRVIQTKKGITTNGQEKMQVSGRVFTDAFGRVTGRHDPFCENRGLSLGTFNNNVSTLIDTIEYDILDRDTLIRQPSMNYTTHKSYNIQNDQSNRYRFTLSITDPNNHTTVQYSDYDGRQVQVSDALTGKTLFEYDAVNSFKLVNNIFIILLNILSPIKL